MVVLGNRCRDQEDFAQALTWYRKAAELGSPLGECALGVVHDLGIGVPVDEAQAKAWYLRAARQGDVRAQFNLGNMILSGRGGQSGSGGEMVSGGRQAGRCGGAFRARRAL